MTRCRNDRSRIRLAFLGFCVAASALVQSCNRRNAFYPSLVDAKRAGEVDRGWLPDYLPVSSHAIHIAYDPESPTTWCAFEYSPADASSLLKNLTRVDTLPSRVKHVDGPRESWWPHFLTGDLDLAAIHSRGFDVYVAVEPDVQSKTNLVLFVLDFGSGRGFFFRTPHQ